MPDAHEPHDAFLDLAGSRVHVRSWGTGPPLLCLHGLGGGTHFFAAVAPALAERRRVVAVDLPGSGTSPAWPAFSFEQAAEVLIALVAFESAAPVILLGHSMGTIVALEAIRRRPDLASALIVVGGLPEPLPGARTRIAERSSVVRTRGLAGLGEAVVTANFSRRTRAEQPDLTAGFAERFEQQDATAYAATAEALAAWQAPPLPPMSGVRCLVITGEDDLYAPPEAARAFARTLPGGTRIEVMPDCGHLPFLEQPAAFAAIVREFLAVDRSGRLEVEG